MSRLWTLCNEIRKGFRGYRLPVATPNSSAFRSSRCLSSSSVTKGGVQIPLLVLPPAENGEILPVFNPFDSRFYEFTLPVEVRGPDNEIHGSGHGWLVMAKNRIESTRIGKDISLYNPITRDHILLPFLPCNSGDDCVTSAQILCNPSSASFGQPLLSIVYCFSQILIYRQGDYRWYHVITNPGGVGRILRTLYHEAAAKLYALYDDYAILAVLDLVSLFLYKDEDDSSEDEDEDEDDDYYPLKPIINTPSAQIESLKGLKHLVSSAGDLLLVVGQDWPCSDGRPQYDVFKLDMITEEGWGHFGWVRAANIGNHTLFACRDHVVSVLCDPNFTDARANQIYHFKQHSKHEYVRSPDNNIVKVPADVQVWDIMTGTNNGDGEQLSFTTSKILRQMSSTWYTDNAAWMVPSLELDDSLDCLNSDSS